MFRLRPFTARVARAAVQQQKRQLSIHEYLSADLLRKSGVGVPYGAVATTAAEAEAIAKKIGGDDMVCDLKDELWEYISGVAAIAPRTLS